MPPRPDGHRLPLASVRTWQPVRKQRSIVPRGSVTVTPTLVTPDVLQLPAGNYGLEAELIDLELKSDVGALQIVPRPA